VSQEDSVSLRAPRRPDAHRARAEPDPAIDRWIRTTLGNDPPRAKSLIVTIWGDALAPHGGAVWLSGLIRLLEPFGISERLARTSVFRLTRDGWLAAEPHGRRSRYCLTPDGVARFAEAYRKIYAARDGDWDERWDIVLARTSEMPVAARRALRDELRWAGFGTFGIDAFARPAQGDADITRIARRLDVANRIAIARASDTRSGPTLAARVDQAWNLAALARDYRRFLALFGGVIERFRIRGAEASDPQQCLVVRMLLIHAFRRVLLRDPQLPPALLPLDWPGAAAHALTRDFYRLTLKRAEAHLAATLGSSQEPWPPANRDFYQRFGGLDA
jgi:phenylacetic acid degradation operon negative regulatory protein